MFRERRSEWSAFFMSFQLCLVIPADQFGAQGETVLFSFPSFTWNTDDTDLMDLQRFDSSRNDPIPVQG